MPGEPAGRECNFATFRFVHIQSPFSKVLR